MANCPTCGHLLRPNRGEELLRLLAFGAVRRDVYRGDGCDLWFVTYTKSNREYQPFAGDVVRELVMAGRLVETYPGCADCYSLPPVTNPAQSSSSSRRLSIASERQ